MLQNYFNQRKQVLLNKKDRSSIGKWDDKIKSLCDKINKLPQYYTTSSCSGRIIIMTDQEKKAQGLFKFVGHDLIQLEDLLKIQLKKDLKFKQEPMILHIACEKLEDANHLLKLAQKAGFKKTGIIALNKRIIIEINGSEKIEFPFSKNNQLLVGQEFLEVIVQKANKNLEKNWKLINEFERLI